MKVYKERFNSWGQTCTQTTRLGRCKSDRITKEWTKTTKEAFGDNPETRKGYLAEQMVFKYLSSTYKWVTWFEDRYDKQVAGIDFQFKKQGWANFYTADVKANLCNGKFFVYPDEIGHKSNDRMIHVDVDSGWAVEYSRESMISYIKNMPLHLDKKGKRYTRLDVFNPEVLQKVSFFRRFLLEKTTNKKLSEKDIKIKQLDDELSRIIN